MRLRICKWSEYQHYKDRNPPWIKLHYAMLSSKTWVTLDDASRVLAIASMLIASKEDGEFDADPDYFKRVAYLNKTPDWKPLISKGFCQIVDTLQADASTMQANARPEERQSRGETEAETEEIPPVGGDTCPLRSLPKIARLYEGIRAILLEVHPHAKLADIGTAKEIEDRKEIERIVRLDGYDEQAVIDTLGYVLQDEPHSDRFMWRDQFRSFAGLRKVSNGATKFSRMHDAMRKFKETGPRLEIPSGVPQKPPYPGMVFQDGAWIHP